MGNEFKWDPYYNIGVEHIDQEHQRLFRIINKLMRIKEEQKDTRWACEQSITFFERHAVEHFADEEEYMRSIGYPDLKQHQRLHQDFRENTLPALKKEIEMADFRYEALDHFIGVCAGWLIGHSLTEDAAIVGKGTARFGKILPGEDLDTLKAVLKQLAFDLFRVESHMVTDSYGGERFGDGIYYRLIFDTRAPDKNYEVLLAFEEKMLIRTVGRALGIKTAKLDSLIMHAARYTAKQYVQRVLEQFPELQRYTLKEENLLNYEQFKTIFDKQPMQASFLFDTGKGYMAYSVIAPHLLEETSAAAIGSENALSEIEAYLRQHEEETRELKQKPKILLVDDSPTIQKMMEEMLSDKYDVTTVSSGVAAIRSIVLNKPDLVLLDYEMPVCDGPQTLEMLQTETELSDVRVVFLTGRSDPASVKRVMSLNPTGYLLKNMKPEDLRQKIDAFFAKKP